MKKLILMICLLPVLAVAQNSTKTFSVNDSSFYVKEKTNLAGSLQLESGVSTPVLRNGNLSFAVNLAYVQNLSNPWKSNSWTTGASFGYRLNRSFSAYTKTNSNFNGNYWQETGLRTTLFRTDNYVVSANAGYVFAYPYKNKQKNSWTTGVTVSFPVKSLLK